MKTFFSVLLVSLVLISCNNNSSADVPVSPDSTGIGPQGDTIAKSYLPVASFIKGDMNLVDTYAAGIVLKKEAGNKKDSTYINPEQFKQLAATFLPPELDSQAFHKMFTESMLANPDGDGLAFMYTTNDTSSSVTKVIVYTLAGENASKVSRIYMERAIARGDTSISQKLTWKMKEYLIIAENKQTSGGYNATVVRKAIWDPQRFGE